MTVHTAHRTESRLVQPILYDDCPRCEEHAQHPVESLDRSHVERLWNRMVDVEHGGGAVHYASAAEGQACKHLLLVALFLERFTSVYPWERLDRLGAVDPFDKAER